jgi:hypothetical protein
MILLEDNAHSCKYLKGDSSERRWEEVRVTSCSLNPHRLSAWLKLFNNNFACVFY